jgi:hypothetical protein
MIRIKIRMTKIKGYHDTLNFKDLWKHIHYFVMSCVTPLNQRKFLMPSRAAVNRTVRSASSRPGSRRLHKKTKEITVEKRLCQLGWTLPADVHASSQDYQISHIADWILPTTRTESVFSQARKKKNWMQARKYWSKMWWSVHLHWS